MHKSKANKTHCATSKPIRASGPLSAHEIKNQKEIKIPFCSFEKTAVVNEGDYIFRLSFVGRKLVLSYQEGHDTKVVE